MWRALTDNIGWKLLALTLAALLWFSLVGDPEMVTTRPLPILYRNLPRDVTIASSLPDHVDVEVSGSPRKLALERFQMAAVLLDLSGIAQPGQKTFTLNASNVILPDGVVFRRAVPSQLQLLFDRTAVRELEPRVNISQPPPEGYQVTRKEVSPSRLVVTGPERRMRDLEFVQTDPIDLSGVVGEREFRVAAAVTDPQVRFVSPTLVTVRITVEKK